MKSRRSALVLAVGLAVGLAGCADAGEPGATPGEDAAAGIPRPSGDANVHANADSDAPQVEMAFAGSVVAVDDAGPEPWVTFAVEHWFTDDLGSPIGLWAPELDAAAGQEWLVAATRYQIGDGPGGDVLAGQSVAWDPDTFAAWEQEWGGSVQPGGETAEASADPAVVADLAAARQRWDDNEPPSWTAIIRWSEGEQEFGTCGSGPVRVVVEAGRVTEAIDLDADCHVADPPTIAALFDRAEQVAGAFEEAPTYDDTWGFPMFLSAWDRSVQVEASVSDFVDEARPLGQGSPADVLADARARWERAGLTDYTMVVAPQCFCPFHGEVEVEVAAGEVIALTPRQPDVSAESYDGLDLTVDGIFAEIASSIASGRVHATYDDDLGHPTWASLDPMPNAVDDEITWTVSSLEPTDG